MQSLAGKTILVTGASSGIGRACSEMLSKLGARLILIGRDPGSLSAVAPLANPQIHVCDVADENAIKTLIGKLRGTAPIDGWLLAAGAHSLRPIAMESRESMRHVWEVNVGGSLGLIALAMKARIIPKEASILLFSSSAAQAGAAGASSYAASKGALEAAVRSLAIEFAPQRIRVNAIAPGVVRTHMSEKLLSKLLPEQKAKLEAEHPLGFGTPDDVVGAVLFFLSDYSRWVTGTVLPVDGGFCAR